MVEESSKVQYGRTLIEYGIRRSERRKTVAVAVDPVEGVMLTAPVGVAVDRLDRVVKEKARWIVERLLLVEDGEPRPEARQYVSGESITYLGRHYRLRVKSLDRPQRTRLERSWLVVSVDRDLGEKAKAAAVEKAVCGWYLDHARARLEARTQIWASQAGVEITDIMVKDQQKRWASCDEKGVSSGSTGGLSRRLCAWWTTSWPMRSCIASTATTRRRTGAGLGC
ncbi:MAG: YgjP-like metallopeptidase domain-containing protein [Nannocystaceae bacterium]